VSKLTTVIPTSLSSRHPNMLPFTKNNPTQIGEWPLCHSPVYNNIGIFMKVYKNRSLLWIT
jgi:hypothetical protein